MLIVLSNTFCIKSTLSTQVFHFSMKLAMFYNLKKPLPETLLNSNSIVMIIHFQNYKAKFKGRKLSKLILQQTPVA